jgi:hypothetical protein
LGTNRPRVAPVVRLHPPFLELGITLAASVTGIVLLFTGQALWLFAGVNALGFVLAFAIGTLRARQLKPAMNQIRRDTGYTPWVQTVWPTWARRAFFIYLGLLVLLVVLLFFLFVGATLDERFG